MGDKMSTQELVNTINGKVFGVTGSKPGENDFGQCTAVLHRWEQMLGLPIVYGHAFDMYANASNSTYDKTLNTASAVPPAGAQVVYIKGYGGSAVGHVSVALEGCTVNKLRVIEQNNRIGGGDGRTRVFESDYGGVYGWFSPKGWSNNITGDVMDLESAKQLAEAMAGRNPNDQSNINDLQKNHVGGNAVNDIKAWYSSGERRDFLKRQADEKAVLQKQNQDLQSQVKSQQDQINALNEKLKQGGLPQETVDQVKETNTIVKWIKAKLEGIFK